MTRFRDGSPDVGERNVCVADDDDDDDDDDDSGGNVMMMRLVMIFK